MPLLPFAQLDLPGEIRLAAGRYLVRPPGAPGADADVLAIRVLGAPRARSRLRRGRPVALERQPDAPPLALSRVTMVKATPFDSETPAAEWLERISGDDELAAGLAGEVARTLNRAILAHRVGAPDPYAAEIEASAAVAIRFGYGSGEEVAEGRWSAARELPERRRRSLRREVVDSVGAQERVAAVLGGRDPVSAAEALLLYAELSSAEERPAIAAIAAAAAVEALIRSGADGGEATTALQPLRERALSGAEIEPAALRDGLRAARRAIRAADR